MKPSDALAEINHLDDVYSHVQTNFSSSSVIILGDLNADCSYINKTEYQNLDLKVSGDYTWYIQEDTDTTVSNSVCTYDRIISKSLNIENAGIYNFKEAFEIDQTTAESVSIHYPVEFSLKLP